MVFATKQFSIDDMKVIFYGFSVYITDSTKFWGVFIDDKLDCKKHILYKQHAKHQNI